MRPLRGRLREAAAGTRRFFRGSRAARITLIVLGCLVLAGVILDAALDRPLRALVERRMNEKLLGYTAKIRKADFRVIGLALELQGAVITQDAHPDPPVIDVPKLRMSVHWAALVVLRLVADATFTDPRVNLNLVQLQEENNDPVPVQRRGWQQALEAIYPLKISELKIKNGTVSYLGESDTRPLELSGVDFVAHNIRNVRSRHRTYPSTLHAEAWVFDSGRAVIDGHANFLAEPLPAIQGRMDLQLVELTFFEPLAKKMGLTIQQGFLSGGGTVEWAPPKVQVVELESMEIVAAAVEYESGKGPTPEARTAGKKITEVAKTAIKDPASHFRIRRLVFRDGSLSVVNRTQDPPYRLDFSKANIEMTNFSSRVTDGAAQAKLDAVFMGSGAMLANATFYPQDEHANFEGKLAIGHTPLKSLNNMLRARGKFDVARGTFELYSEFRVRDGYIDGYVKPIFSDIEVLDSEQDKHKNLFRKMWEGIVGGAAKLLQNDDGKVATVTSLKGRVDDPKASAAQIFHGLLRNAFAKAIVPGFHREIKRVEPAKFRAAMKRERKEAEAQRPR